MLEILILFIKVSGILTFGFIFRAILKGDETYLLKILSVLLLIGLSGVFGITILEILNEVTK